MDKAEYERQMSVIEEIFNKSIKILDQKYADSNNPVAVGDIVIDHIGAIKVTKIRIGKSGTYTAGMPCCVYEGLMLKKDFSPQKSGKSRSVWQGNMVKAFTPK